MSSNEKYLGNLPRFGKNKAEVFNLLINKVKAKIRSGQASLLSLVGRITLIKSVVSAILVYNMPVVRFPRKNSKKVDKIYRRFWWGR